jgi:outer membrane murein-binding lipoprotein Lpp
MKLRFIVIIAAIVLGAACLGGALAMRGSNDDRLQEAQAQAKALADQQTDLEQDELATAANNRRLGTEVDHVNRAHAPVLLTRDALRYQTTKRLEYLERMQTAARNGARAELQALLHDDVPASQQAFVDALNTFIAEYNKPIFVTND